MTEARHGLSIHELRTEYLRNPIGIDVRLPRTSWHIDSQRRGCMQAAYQILVADTLSRLDADHGDAWDSGRVASSASVHVAYQGAPLQSRTRYYWKVRVWDDRGNVSPWSEPAFWEMALLDSSEWRAGWIAPDVASDPTTSGPCPLLRTSFALDGEISAARLYVTSRGLYELELNGSRVGDRRFTPGWTSYGHRLQYQTYDVTDQLRSGENALGAVLGDGWYRGFLLWNGERNFYGKELALLAQLHIDYADGRTQIVATGPDWRSSTGPILASDIYNGEIYDARLAIAGWSSPGFDDGTWSGVHRLQQPDVRLVAQLAPPVRRIAELRAVSIERSAAGTYLVDMGQNLVGGVRLRASGEAGTTIVLKHAEVLDRHGQLHTDNLRTADQQDTFVLAGAGVESFEPRFSFHGFRYVSIENYPGELTLDDLVAVVVHSDLEASGEFRCSNPSINQLQDNIVWGQRGNFLDVPTDCPQRDERLGWTGDAQVFIRTACFNMDAAGFFAKWLQDLALDQYPDGNVPHVIPDVGLGAGAPAWGDAAVVCPWTLYLLYGDRRVLHEQYESMRGWVGYVESQAGDELIWRVPSSFGDWLAVPSEDPRFPNAVTDIGLIGTAYFAYTTHLVGLAARVLGEDADAERFDDLSIRIRAAFCREFLTPAGRLASNTQTAYALALVFDLLPVESRPEAARRLAADVRERGNHLSTGFVGTPLLCHALSDAGFLDEAYALLAQDTYPSWLYPVSQGATTIWERWDGMRPDGTLQSASMNSFNHYAYGAIGDWMYRVLAGIDIDPAEPGYKHSSIRPQVVGDLTHVTARLRTVHGPLAVAWERDGRGMRVEVTVPGNTRSTLRLPWATLPHVTERSEPLQRADGVGAVRQEPDGLVIELGSGRYSFAYALDDAREGVLQGKPDREVPPQPQNASTTDRSEST